MDSILDLAKSLVFSERNKAYGDGMKEFTKVANVFNALTGRDLRPDEAVMFMVVLKLVRETYRHKTDNIVDAAGYLEILAQVILAMKAEERKET